MTDAPTAAARTTTPTESAEPQAAGPASGGVRPARITDTVPTAAQIGLSPQLVALAVGMATALVLLVAFPAELFNSTLEEHEAEVSALLTGSVAALRRLVPARVSMSGSEAVTLALFVTVGTVLTILLSGAEAAGGNWPAQIVGLLVAIPVVTMVAEWPQERAARRLTGVKGRIRVIPAAIVAAVVSATVSRLLHLQPAYLYGLFAGYAAAKPRPMTAQQEGRSVLQAVGVVAGFGILCWLVWTPFHARAYAGDPSWFAVLADAVLFWCFVLSIEGLVFALIPLRFLDGHLLRSWRLVAWLVPQVLIGAFFLYVFVLHGTRGDVGPGAIVRALLFFAIFGLVSVAVWAYFRWDGRPSRHVGGDVAARS